MVELQLKEVGKNPDLIREFLELPVGLYKNMPCWIRPLNKDIEDIFDPQKNKKFRSGDCRRWILKDSTGKTIGRIAAFFDNRLFKPEKPKIGGFGFFECTDNQQAAEMLLSAAENWLKEQGLDGMDGPVNFGDRDKNWGLLVDGFDREPNYGMPYTMPFYPALFERYGLQVFFYQLTYFREVMAPLSPKLQEKYNRIIPDKSFRFEHFKPQQAEKYVVAFTEIYNQAWSKHSGVPEMSSSHVRALFKRLAPVMDKRLLWFGFHNERPVCFFLMLPELNQFFKHVNGKLDLWGKLKFVWYRNVIGTDKMFGVIFGVVPDFQGKGLEGALIVACRPTIIKTRYRKLEMNWIGDFNPRMIHLMETLGATEVKRHATYRIFFDRNHLFEREKTI
jgi:hypothetical protein